MKLRTVKLYKVQAAGNDFLLLNALSGEKNALFYASLAKHLCQRRYMLGADGLLAIEPALRQSFTMRIFNADGSEAEMCGNGARAAAFWYYT